MENSMEGECQVLVLTVSEVRRLIDISEIADYIKEAFDTALTRTTTGDGTSQAVMIQIVPDTTN